MHINKKKVLRKGRTIKPDAKVVYVEVKSKSQAGVEYTKYKKTLIKA